MTLIERKQLSEKLAIQDQRSLAKLDYPGVRVGILLFRKRR